MYKVIRAFVDGTDNNRFYPVGSAYPTEGVKASKVRINSLLTGSNKNGKVYLEEVAELDEETNDPDGENAEET